MCPHLSFYKNFNNSNYLQGSVNSINIVCRYFIIVKLTKINALLSHTPEVFIPIIVQPSDAENNSEGLINEGWSSKKVNYETMIPSPINQQKNNNVGILDPESFRDILIDYR